MSRRGCGAVPSPHRRDSREGSPMRTLLLGIGAVALALAFTGPARADDWRSYGGPGYIGPGFASPRYGAYYPGYGYGYRPGHLDYVPGHYHRHHGHYHYHPPHVDYHYRGRYYEV